MIIEDDYIFLIPKYQFAPKHKHSMLHILLSNDNIEVLSKDEYISGNFIMIDSWFEHEVKLKNSKCLIYLIDPGSSMADIIREKYLKESGIVKIELNNIIENFLLNIDLNNLAFKSRELLEIIGIKDNYKLNNKKDERIQEVIDGVKKGIYIDLEVKEIARKVYLSESRLSHLFKTETGMNLKNYILMNKMKNAFINLKSGKSITEAAHDSNFFDTAHLCNLVKKTTGINISEIIK